MEILILGASRIVTKRVIPALTKMPGVTQIHVASRRDFAPGFLPANKAGRVFQDYGEGLESSEPCLTYISLPNSLHAEWAERALQQGHHVIVDKPAFTTPEAADRLLGLASLRGSCLAEATVWSYHPQVRTAIEAFRDAGQEPMRVTATFSFPPLSPLDFRYRGDLGGGSLFDLGPYAASCGRVFFNAPPRDVICRVHSRDGEDGVDTSFSVLACYPEEKALIGHFGFTTEYANEISLLGPELRVQMDRAFTAPSDLDLAVRVRRKNQESVIHVAGADSFQSFLEDVLEAIRTRTWERFSAALLADALCLHRLRASAEAVHHADQSLGLSRRI